MKHFLKLRGKSYMKCSLAGNLLVTATVETIQRNPSTSSAAQRLQVVQQMIENITLLILLE